MKKLLTFIILTLAFGCSYAQFAKIVDKDGSVNLRKESNIKSRVIGKIKSGEIVYVYIGNENSSWMPVDYYQENGSILSGYIHISRLLFIDSYEEIPSVSEDENGASFIMRNFDIQIRSEKFNYKENQKYFAEKHYKDYSLPTYKGQNIWGMSSLIPKTHYISIKVHIGNQYVEIPEKDIENLFDVNNASAHCFFDKKTETLYIISMNADGSDTYEVVWIIEKGKYKGRKVYDTAL